MAARPKRATIPLEDGLIQLPGQGAGPEWIWVDTCHIVDCDCRAAIVLASRAGKDSLLASAAKVRKALADQEEVSGLEALLGAEVAGVELDIDSGQMVSLDEGELEPVFERAPWFRAVVDRIDGNVLDDIGRLWHHGKGQPDPEQAPLHPREIQDWTPGDEVSWDEAYWGLRADGYVFGDELYEVAEYYCVMPDCDCGRVTLSIGKAGEEEDVLVGTVVLEKDAGPAFELHDGTREQLEQVWAAYQKRYPAWRERQAAREPRMKEFGKLLVAYHEQMSRPKVGPNDPCPCGSGKKYKKCCWKKQIGS